MRISDWSSDVCSSDLRVLRAVRARRPRRTDRRAADAIPVHRVRAPGRGPPAALLAPVDPTRHRAAGVRPALDRARGAGHDRRRDARQGRSEEHTSELQSLMRISYAVFCLKKTKNTKNQK